MIHKLVAGAVLAVLCWFAVRLRALVDRERKPPLKDLLDYDEETWIELINRQKQKTGVER